MTKVHRGAPVRGRQVLDRADRPARVTRRWSARPARLDAIVLIQTIEDAEEVEFVDPERVAYITQTTLSVDETTEIIAVLRRRFPAIRAPKRDDICYATSNRQWAVKDLLEVVDLLLVIGSRNSSNSNRLVEVARAGGVQLTSDRRRDRHRRELAGRCGVGGSPRAPRHRRSWSSGCATGSGRVASTRSSRSSPSTRTSSSRLPVELRRELALAEAQG